MRGKKAKIIRTIVYGDRVSSAKGRKYFYDPVHMTRTLHADKDRKLYQKMKKEV